jgi:hypothetical protein
MDPLASSRCLVALVRLFFSDPSSRLAHPAAESDRQAVHVELFVI